MPATKQEEQGHAHRSWSPPKPLSSLSLCLSCMCLSALACSRCCCSAFPHTRPACSLTLRCHVSACAGSNQRSRVASAVKQRDEALKELAIGLACCIFTLRDVSPSCLVPPLFFASMQQRKRISPLFSFERVLGLGFSPACVLSVLFAPLNVAELASAPGPCVSCCTSCSNANAVMQWVFFQTSYRDQLSSFVRPFSSTLLCPSSLLFQNSLLLLATHSLLVLVKPPFANPPIQGHIPAIFAVLAKGSLDLLSSAASVSPTATATTVLPSASEPPPQAKEIGVQSELATGTATLGLAAAGEVKQTNKDALSGLGVEGMYHVSSRAKARARCTVG